MLSDELTKNLDIKTTHDALQAASVKSPETYIPNKPIDSDNVGEVTKVLVGAVLSEVPLIGSLLSGLLDIFWQGGEKYIWEDIKGKVEALVDDKIQQKEAEDIETQLNSIGRLLKSFALQPPESQAKNFNPILNAILMNVDSIIYNKSPWYSLAYIVPFGTLYLAALWTRWNFCIDIDGSDHSKLEYEHDLEKAIQELNQRVKEARSACIERRKEGIKEVDTHYHSGKAWLEAEDQHSHSKYKMWAQEYLWKENKKNLSEQLHYEVDYIYGAKLDKILEPTHLWARYSPSYKAQCHEHLEYPPWSWTYVQDYVDMTRFDSSSYYKEHGRITRIVLHESKDSYGQPQVAGLELVYGDHPYLIGQQMGTSLIMDLANDEMITQISAKLSKDHTLASLAFTKARQTIDSQGRAQFDKHESISVSQPTGILGILVPLFFSPKAEASAAIAQAIPDLTYNGEASTPHPTCLLSVCGWFCNDDRYTHKGFGRYIGFLQPVFGCWETIGVDGKSTWAMEDPRGKKQ
ncbi:hypothetical protein QYS62_003173 [Fusarium acuminatum]|uniref:Pesticidal crystal protein N-terminal domain-containing protein n=1 Tax=Fusarium acuminatum TaxID=5515 RepID=A0ABZ2WN85_9HYPO